MQLSKACFAFRDELTRSNRSWLRKESRRLLLSHSRMMHTQTRVLELL